MSRMESTRRSSLPAKRAHAALVLEDGRAFIGAPLGAQRAGLVNEPVAPSEARIDELIAAARRVAALAGQDLLAQASRTHKEEWLDPLPPELKTRRRSDGEGLLVAVVDYGVKANILRSLRERGCRVVVLPHAASLADVEALGAAGLVCVYGPWAPN